MSMRKHALIAALALVCSVAAPASAQQPSGYSPTFVVISTFIPGAELSYPFAFKNGSSLVDVKVSRIEVVSCSTRSITGGLMSYWIHPSTTITNGVTTQVSSYSYAAANGASFPANVIGSRSPTTVVFENLQANQLPFSRPLIINNEETATDHFSDAWDAYEGGREANALFLPKGRNRGFVLQLHRLGAADITDGCVMVKTVFTAK